MNDIERFWSFVKIKSSDNCWEWTGALCGGRKIRLYGTFTRSRKLGGRRCVLAHRMAYCIANDIDITEFPSNIVVRHKCDNGKCCNPAHLQGGTQIDNVNDAVVRDRVASGSAVSSARLDENQVRVIKKRLAVGEYHHVIASDYNVHRVTITDISCGRTWRRIKD